MFIPTIMDDLKDFKNSLEEITADMLETSREAVLEMEPEHDNKLLKYHDKTLMDEELLMDKRRRWFLATWNLLLVKML